MIDERDLLRAETESHARMTENFGGEHVRIIDEINERHSKLFRAMFNASWFWLALLILVASWADAWFLWLCVALQSVMAVYVTYRWNQYRRAGYYGRTGTEA